MERPHPFYPVSAWLRGPPTDLQPALREDLEADVVIVGGGCTGLSAALALRQEGASVILLDRQFAGAGASGRNAGYLAGPAVMDLSFMLRMNGRRGAEKGVRFASAAVEFTERLLAEWGIDCAYHRSGVLLAAVHPRQEQRLHVWAERYRDLGGNLEVLSPGAMAERGIPKAFRCALYDETGGVFDPGLFVSGLRRVVLDAGVRVFEQSSALGFELGRRIQVRTSEGSVTADWAVLATNAYTRELWRGFRKMWPLRVSGFETAPLDDPQREALGWKGWEGINTLHEVTESYRRSERGTVLGTTKVFSHAWNGKRPPGYAPDVFRALEAAFRDRFPMLADLPVSGFWSGWIAHTTDFRPLMGVAGRSGNLLYGLGYCGHGVAQAILMGAVLAERICGREHPLEECVRRRAWGWPPEPLTWGMISLLRAGLGWVDWGVDQALRR